jgi:hypothetical protein
MAITELAPSVTDLSTEVDTKQDERRFTQFLLGHGYVVAAEPDELPIDGSGAVIMPDLRVYAVEGQLLDPRGPRVYIELTSADRFTHCGDLSRVTRAKNRAHSDSRQEFIKPSDYLRRKRRRIEQAKELNPDVIIVTLRYDEQLKIMRNPKRLENKLVGAIHAHPKPHLALVH